MKRDQNEQRLDRDPQHEELCAYLLGELQGEELARVEAALVDSAELRRECERLSATIGLVQDLCAVDDESLSQGSRDRLLADASRVAVAAGSNPETADVASSGSEPAAHGTHPAAHTSPNELNISSSLMRAAAAILFVGAGVVGLLEWIDSDGEQDEQLADAMASDDTVRRNLRDEDTGRANAARLREGRKDALKPEQLGKIAMHDSSGSREMKNFGSEADGQQIAESPFTKTLTDGPFDSLTDSMRAKLSKSAAVSGAEILHVDAGLEGLTSELVAGFEWGDLAQNELGADSAEAVGVGAQPVTRDGLGDGDPHYSLTKQTSDLDAITFGIPPTGAGGSPSQNLGRETLLGEEALEQQSDGPSLADQESLAVQLRAELESLGYLASANELSENGRAYKGPGDSVPPLSKGHESRSALQHQITVTRAQGGSGPVAPGQTPPSAGMQLGGGLNDAAKVLTLDAKKQGAFVGYSVTGTPGVPKLRSNTLGLEPIRSLSTLELSGAAAEPAEPAEPANGVDYFYLGGTNDLLAGKGLVLTDRSAPHMPGHLELDDLALGVFFEAGAAPDVTRSFYRGLTGGGDFGQPFLTVAQALKLLDKDQEVLHLVVLDGMTDGQRDALVECESRRRMRMCRPLPQEGPRDMYFRFWGDNAFERADLDPQSTFAADVDTASYALARKYVREGHLPTKAQIRTEEFVNYFDPDLSAPVASTFAIHTELAPSLFGGSEDRWMLRVGVRGREVPKAERKPLSLTFVIDNSGSMKEGQRLQLVQHSLRLLVSELDARDQIGLVVFSDDARVILPMTSAANRGLIEVAIEQMRAEGDTNADAGLRMGYELAAGDLVSDRNYRVVMFSDGVANTGQTDQKRILESVKQHTDAGIYLNTIGVGMNNHNDVFLEQLADGGDGICDYVDDQAAAYRALVERFTSTFDPIASDVKIQVEFDPQQVGRYRLLGYENRAIADQDFRNDAVDAGEIGSGHQVVALYEIERTSAAATETPLAQVRVRWLPVKSAGQSNEALANLDGQTGGPESTVSAATEISEVVHGNSAVASFHAASKGFRLSTVVAQYAEFLRRSTHARGDSYEKLLQESATLAGELGDSDVHEFLSLVRESARLIIDAANARTDLDLVLDEYRRFQILEKELEHLKAAKTDDLLKQLQDQNQQLEDKIRDAIRDQVRNG
ncbi:MAG: Ca-activated chloride channel family protein [Planctomycetota bacterium]